MTIMLNNQETMMEAEEILVVPMPTRQQLLLHNLTPQRPTMTMASMLNNQETMMEAEDILVVPMLPTGGTKRKRMRRTSRRMHNSYRISIGIGAAASRHLFRFSCRATAHGSGPCGGAI